MSATVWIIDDDRSIRWVLERALSRADLETVSFESGEGILERLEQDQPDAVISDIRMPGIDGITLLRSISERFPMVPVIIMTAHSDLDSAVSSYQTGAFEYLPKPFDVDEALSLIQRAIDHGREQRSSAREREAEHAGENAEIIGEAPAMQEVFRAIGRLSHSNITVLINGESGTGKELVARALHNHSPRSGGPFVALNMAAIPRDLIESELFGHEKGAFTGANAARQGRFEQSNGGTLFLDEIGEISQDLQVKLLRVLQEKTIERVGGTEPVHVDFRLVAATNKNLKQAVADGSFREDLFYRLNVVQIEMPPLRERREDIPLLAAHFLHKYASENERDIEGFSPEALDSLTGFDWPGNVRQLENVIERSVVLSSGRKIELDDLPVEIRGEETQLKSAVDLLPNRLDLADTLEKLEAALIRRALVRNGFVQVKAAESLGISKSLLQYKLKKYGISGKK